MAARLSGDHIDPGWSFMVSKKLRCPECDSLIAPDDIRAPSFTCKHCHRELSMPRKYSLMVRLSTAPVTFLICYVLGFRGITLFLTWLISTPVIGGLVVMPLSFRLLPPTLERFLPEGSLGLGPK